MSALIVIALYVPAAPAAEADDLLSQGAKLLHQAVTGEDSALVPAAIALTRASSLFQGDGDDEGARKTNALLYWCKKRMTLADIEAFNKGADSASTRKLIDVSKAVAASQADAYYRRAEECARKHPDDHLLIAVRFFEVADRFAQTPVGVKAMRRSLDAMQKVRVRSGVTAPPSDEVGPASYPEVAVIEERRTASVEKARAAYLKKLKSAFDSARRAGRLDAVNLIDAEMRAVKESDTVATASEFDSLSLRYAQKTYREARHRALAAYVKELDRLVSTETRKGNLEKARYCRGLSSKAKRQLPPMTIQKAEGDWRPFVKGVKCYIGANEFVMEVPEQLNGKYYLEVSKGKLNIRVNGNVTLYAFGVHAVKGLQRIGFRPAPGLRVVSGGMGRKPKAYPVYMKRCRRGDVVVERNFWLMLIVD